MPCDISVVGGVVIAKTSGTITNEEHKHILSLIVSAYDASGADAVLVNHRQAEIDCSVEDAAAFGAWIHTCFAARHPCFIAILSNTSDIANERAINASLAYVNQISHRFQVNRYLDDALPFDDLNIWRAKVGSAYKDTACLSSPRRRAAAQSCLASQNH